jgi:hypothetical protein
MRDPVSSPAPRDARERDQLELVAELNAQGTMATAGASFCTRVNPEETT